MTVQYNLWDLVKGDCDRLMEVKITAIKLKNSTAKYKVTAHYGAA